MGPAGKPGCQGGPVYAFKGVGLNNLSLTWTPRCPPHTQIIWAPSLHYVRGVRADPPFEEPPRPTARPGLEDKAVFVEGSAGVGWAGSHVNVC